MATYRGNWKDNTTSLRKMNLKEVKRTVNIILLGKTGSGKSATGNTLLRRNAFKAIGSKKSITEESRLECSIIDGDLINVVDTPGLMDTNTSIEKTLEEIYMAMSLCPEGFNAILFVMNWNGRFTKEENKTLQLLKKYLGDRFIEDYCIIAMTRGDDFEDEMEDLDFSEWLDSQDEPPEFFKLINDCQKRVVLFSNKGKKFEEERKQSLKQVLYIISTMPDRYTSEDFNKCAKEREMLSVKFNLPAQKQYVQQELSLINQGIQETRSIIKQMEKEKRKEGINELRKSADLKYQQLEGRIGSLVEKITYDDKGTGVMEELSTEVESYLTTIQDIKQLSITEQKKCLLNLENKVLLEKNQSTGWGRFFLTIVGVAIGAVGGVAIGAVAALSAPFAFIGGAIGGTAAYQASKE